MPVDYRPFRNIRSLDDLLLVEREWTARGVSVKLPPAPYYAEICAWVNVRCAEDDLVRGTEQTLMAGMLGGDTAWRLLLTPHGYLRFEAGQGDGRLAADAVLPVHACVDAGHEFRLGVALSNYAWALRDTPYAEEARDYSHVQLLAARGRAAPLELIGGGGIRLPTELAPVPDHLLVGASAGRTSRFTGRIVRVTALNTGRLALVGARGAHSAARFLPPLPGGGGFAPRWVSEDTVEVCTWPEFSQTASYWVFLKLNAVQRAPKWLRVHTIAHGGPNMTPTFFWSSDRKRWRRIVPSRIHLPTPGHEFTVEFEVTPAMARGGYLASGPVFGDEEREALLQWAQGRRHTTVGEIGRSVEGRPIHAIRVGPAGPTPHGVAVVCGQHSPLEIMGGRVIEPIIRRLLRTPQLLRACSFHFIPTVNVDCAHYGGNGLNANSRNTNRHWFDDIQPENAAVREYFDALRQAGQRFDFAIDIHAGGTFRNHVLMPMGPGEGQELSASEAAEQELWCEALERYAGLRKADGWPLPQLRLRASDYFHQVHGCPAFCLELSSCSYFDPVAQQTRVFGTPAFERVAEGLVRAWEERLSG